MQARARTMKTISTSVESNFFLFLCDGRITTWTWQLLVSLVPFFEDDIDVYDRTMRAVSGIDTDARTFSYTDKLITVFGN